MSYTDASSGIWNPQTHQYESTVAAEWSCEAGANKIEVTNHSNNTVIAQLSYASESAYSGINGDFSNETLNLDSAVGTEPSNAPSGSATLSLSGELSSDTSASTKIGTVTLAN